jgi:hypothetical protein
LHLTHSEDSPVADAVIFLSAGHPGRSDDP